MKKLDSFFKDYKFVFLFGLGLHLILPFFSKGFHHPDEYYYSLDFTFDKLGLIFNYVPTWEYNEQIRSWALPSILYCFGFVFKLFGLSDPFVYALLFRLLSSLFAFYATLYFIKVMKERFPTDDFRYLPHLLLLSYPVLFMHLRTSSENWSASLYLLTLAFFYQKKSDYLLGIMICATFFFRFQLGFALLPFIFIAKFEWAKILKWTCGFLFCFLLMVIIDRWGYSEWTLTAYHYFRVNIVEDKVNSFGTHPFYFYLLQTILQLAPLWGVGVVYALVKSIRHFRSDKLARDFILLLFPFLLIHHLIGHKELRFIYLALPILLTLFSRFLVAWKEKWRVYFLLINLVSLLGILVPPYKPLLVYRYLYEHKDEIKELAYLSNHYPLELKAFVSPELKVAKFEENFGTQYVLTQGFKEREIIQSSRNCQPLSSSYPLWLIEMNPLGLLKRSSIWILHRCDERMK